MLWDQENGARPWLVSRHAASDWMLAPDGAGGVYLIERRYNQASDAHEIRLLQAEVGGEPSERHAWAPDPDRVGEGGFAVLEGGALLYARYPGLFTRRLGGRRQPWEAGGPDTVTALRRLVDGRLLLRGEDEVWLQAVGGGTERRWSGLLEVAGEDPPVGGNRLFDADYAAGSLWLAYWGRRRFERHTDAEGRQVLLQLQAPWVPHGIAFGGGAAYLLASSIEPGTSIEPRLWRWQGGTARLLWDGTAATAVMDTTSWGRLKQPEEPPDRSR